MEYTQEQIQTLQNAMHSMYEDNLEFLKIYDKKLHEGIVDLTNCINSGEYETRYELEFVDNSFNILDKNKNKYVYEDSLENYNLNALKELDFTNKGSISSLVNNVYSVDNIEELRLFNNDIQTKSFKKIVHDINEFRTLLANPKTSRESDMKYIPAFVFFGTLLGSHLLPITQKFNSKSYLIIEPDIEIFRLSLFVTEYKMLTKDAKLFFSVGQADPQMIKKIEQFILFDSFENYLYKYYSTSYHDKQLFNNFTLALQNLTPFSYDHYRQLHYTKESIRRINKYPILIENKFSASIQDLPILILSPGPSLRKNFTWLKKNQNRFITIAFGASVKALNEANIIPDIITSVDASTLITKQFPKECRKVYQDSIAMLATDTLEDIMKLFKKENIFIFESNFKIVNNGIKESPALTVGDNTMHLLLSLGFKRIYMLGTDLSLDVDVGVAYDKTHASSGEKMNLHYLKKNIKKISEDVDVSDNHIQIDSNFGNKELYANQLFLKIIESYNAIIDAHRRNFEFDVFNLSDGARIKNIEPLQPMDINLPKIAKEDKKDILREFFLKKAKRNFSKKEHEEMQKEIEFLDKLLLYVKDLKNESKIDENLFYQYRKEYATKIVGHKSYSSLTKSILSNYIKVIDNYINFVFNDKSFECSNAKMMQIKFVWCKQVSSLLKKYKKILKKAQV